MNSTPRSSPEDVAHALDPGVRGVELVALAAHRDPRVRAAVASRTDAPMASLISLAHECDATILKSLVANPASPLWVLRKLAAEPRPEIRDRAIARLAMIERTLGSEHRG